MMAEGLGGRGWPLGEIGLPSSQVIRLMNTDFNTTEDVKDMKPSELSEATGLSLKASVEVLRLAANKQQPNPDDMLQMFQEGSEFPQIVTFCRALDTLLGGGIPLQAVTELSGTPGVGKTQLCIQACVSVQLPQSVGGVGGEAVFVDTRGSFTVKRLKDMASDAVRHVQTISGEDEDVSDFSVESVLKGTHYFRCQNSIEMLAVIKSLPKLIQAHPKIQLLVIDSISFHFRNDFPDVRERAKLTRIVTKELIQPAVKRKMAVIVTNHMTTYVKGKGSAKLSPALGNAWGHCPTIRLNFLWSGEARVATLTKAPQCLNSSAYFHVSVGGLRDVCDDQTSTSRNGDNVLAAKKRKFADPKKRP